MPALRTIMNVALGYSATAEKRIGARYQSPDCSLPYGSHPLQALDFYSAGDAERPLVVFLHGGAWQFGDKTRRRADHKAPFCRGEGWHFAALNFRLVPEVGVAEMARDVARGVTLLLAEARALGVDPARMVLMGHSSGAHLAALVGTDPRFLAETGLAPEALAGVLAIDGAAFDAQARSTGAGWLDRRLIDPAFPPEAPAMRTALSPVVHAANPPNARAFLVLHTGRRHAAEQAQAFELALRAAGTPVQRHDFAGRGAMAHVALSRRFGKRGHAPTEVARQWLVARFG